ncbi:hypothetical protein N825_14910 [Skermanella stibiiresistens SB22]|uniref:TIGR02444 family protein n=1 Tax=Skermanella stibiiresistens SB22 TaxID=1385369 RepID=W9GWC8_9PROT|nr:TIGR02444 family protein [Skermanella stibiiresistens]EWY38195.1 hypothetical protein N825_14910 [Skermanella stibiiresistens SB22]
MATDTGSGAEDGLWRFALDLYGRPGVGEACLSLQDRHGCDVTILLFAAWAGAERGVTLDEADLDTARSAVGAWHDEVVRPLRAIRRRLKQGPPPAPNERTGALRARLQAVEIESERIELEVLAGCLPDRPSDPGAAREAALANLTLAARVPRLDDETQAALRVIADAAASGRTPAL